MSYMPYQNLDGRQAWYTWPNKHHTIEKVEIETNKQYIVLESNTRLVVTLIPEASPQ